MIDNSNSTVDMFDLFVILLTILFIGLKLTNYINWSWWWVLSPLWIPTRIGFIVLLILFITHITH